ncbi:glutamyl-tRNA synthetase [Sporobacter termitidis DSM 10068]|uniref:Glutamate--tRNA ligase n=1 Tax=Sporobacter termitidis DSM 10068 TaxID=1123282 RepID=A0A1M5WW38_9FIRM|nr:glutamate--tRNA ligase [Sporobacter termitidis]SHH91213.1 glutamyl-tRNA synthetase [Sporobacter termitidis DSM 10068]
MAIDKKWLDEMEAKIPKGKVRTRFAPSPTGYMHVGGLRTALYTYLIAKKMGGTFILRIEDTDDKRFVEGATEIIVRTLKSVGLDYDEGPDAGGPSGPYIQSERKPLYRPYAELLCETDAAYYCFCRHVEHDERDHEDLGLVAETEDPCRSLSYEEAKRRADAGEPHVIRMKTPREGTTSFHDEIFGDITVENKTLDDMVLLKSDNLPTYNFANVVDDHLMGITHVIRGSEYLSSAPKYNLLYEAFGWEIPVYITVSPIMRDAQHKLSKRHGDPSYEDLLKLGYVSDAVVNYVALLGWSPGGEREIFTLSELSEIFDVGGISKSPAIFDIDKLTYFNAEYIRAMAPDKFAALAAPYIRAAVKNPAIDIGAVAAILQPRCEKLTDIPEKIDFFDKLPAYETALYVHKKSKTDEAVSLKMLEIVRPVLEALAPWSLEAIHDALMGLAEKLELKNATLLWPLRIALAGKAVTPGGAVEICHILGREETLRRIDIGIGKLSGGKL